MTKVSTTAKLPFFETLKQSFMYFLRNPALYLKFLTLGAVILLFEMFADFPSLCSMRGNCAENWQNKVSVLLLALASVCIIILYCRNIVLKTMKMDWRLFSKTVLMYILYNLLMMIALSLAIIVVVYALAPFLPNNDNSAFIVLVVPVLLSILVAPYMLLFPAIAVGDKSFKLKNVFTMAKGSYMRIFFGQIAMMLPGFGVAYLLMKAYGLIGLNNFFVNEVFVILALSASIADFCLKGSFYAHMYQFFKQQQKLKE